MYEQLEIQSLRGNTELLASTQTHSVDLFLCAMDVEDINLLRACFEIRYGRSENITLRVTHMPTILPVTR